MSEAGRIVGRIGSAPASAPEAWGGQTLERNDDLRAARLARPSPHDPSAVLSRAELAELAAAHIYRATGRVAPLDAHYVARLERGAIRWPGADYRAALAAVLGVPALGEVVPALVEVEVAVPHLMPAVR